MILFQFLSSYNKLVDYYYDSYKSCATTKFATRFLDTKNSVNNEKGNHQ